MELTIIIPTCNGNNSVIECVLALEHNAADIVVVDDASDRPIILPGNKARVIRHNRRRGRSAAINTGLKAAVYDTVLIMGDDTFAEPNMAAKMVREFRRHNDPRLGLTARVLWDPDVPLTLTMKWMEDNVKLRAPILLSKSFVLDHGGYDENFTRELEDTELQLRLKQHGLDLRPLESAVAFRNNIVKIRDLAEREFMEGASAVFLHSKFPESTPEVDDMDLLLRNEGDAQEAAAAIDEISLLEQSGSSVIPAGAAELYVRVCRHYFLHGILEGLRDIGGVRRERGDSNRLPIYRHAVHLENIGEFDEARRLFRLVLHRSGEQHWDGAEYHLGCIETQLGNMQAAQAHFVECLKNNPHHNQARRALNRQSLFREVEPNVFERTEPRTETRVLFIVFGGLSNIVNAFPVMAALRERFHSETVWLTSPEFAPLARASFADAVRETEPRGIIPWEWIHIQGFTHVFFPEPEANQEEWEQGGLHPIDFMAQKCRVEVETHQSWLQPNEDALFEAEEFIRQNGLERGSFVTASHGGSHGRHWPNSNLMQLAQQLPIPTVVFGTRADPEIPGVIPCLKKSFQVIAALIRWSCFYAGPDSGISWLAATTDTPMVVFFDPALRSQFNSGVRDVLRGEKSNVQEYDIYTSVQSVLEHIEEEVKIPILS